MSPTIVARRARWLAEMNLSILGGNESNQTAPNGALSDQQAGPVCVDRSSELLTDILVRGFKLSIADQVICEFGLRSISVASIF